MTTTPSSPTTTTATATTTTGTRNSSVTSSDNTMSRGSTNRSRTSGGSGRSRASGSHSRSGTSGTSIYSNDKRCSTISAGRILFVSCLVAAAVLIGYFAHDIIATSEAHLGEAHYNAIADRALDTAEAITLRKTSGTKTMASIIENRFPNADAWPFVALDGYSEIATNLIETSDGRGMGFCPLVEPGQQALEFEAFAYDYFNAQYGTNHTLGISDFGKGIHIHDPINANTSDSKFLDRDGRFWNADLGSYDASASSYRYLAPMIQHNKGKDSTPVMRNIRNDRGRGKSIDRMMECVHNLQPGEDKHCGEISPFIMSSDGAPSAFIYEPIQPVNSNKLTGFVVSSIRWSDTFTNIFTDQVSGIDLVVTVGDNQTYTYTVRNGNVTLVGKGDHHDRKFDKFQRTTSLTKHAFEDDSYTLTLYPKDDMFVMYSTKNPIVAAVGVGCIIIFTSLMFFVYDCLVSKNIREKGSLLEAKREFMRYVSHEVRTPLNTVVMGLKLLQEDVQNAFGGATSTTHDGTNTNTNTNQCGLHSSKSRLLDGEEASATESTTLSMTAQENLHHNHPPSPPPQPPQQPSSSVQSSILQLSEEILTAANSAVGVLNDFLNYDKIENKSLKLDLSILNIWYDLQQALLGFKLPAEAKDIDLQLDLSALVKQVEQEQGLPQQGNDDEEQQGGGTSPTTSTTSVSQLPLSILEKRVVGDDARISQVFRNILSNSLKFTEKGGRITVRAKWIPPPPTQVTFVGKLNATTHKQHDKTAEALDLSNGKQVIGTPSGQIQIAIQDTGAGMTQEQLEDVFAAGVQFNVNVLQKGNGSGLGMYIAKEIVAQHGGTLTAESEGIGRGATFSITLPLYDIPDEALPESLQRLQVGGNKVPSPPSSTNAEDPEVGETIVVKPEQLRVLVVDDAATNRKLLRRLLERRGHICEEAKDGLEAVIKVLGDQGQNGSGQGNGCEQRRDGDHPYFDTILLDYEMPVCNGPDCVARLRKEGCDSFVVGITGNVLPEDISHFKDCGANEVLHKPVDLDALGALWVEYGISAGSGNPNTRVEDTA